jgi:peptide/nickel transport system substrate-binding protein
MLPEDFPSLDPMVEAANAYGFAAVTPGYDRMVAVEPNGVGFGPYIASSWKQTPTSIKFQVHQNARCSNGQRLTATDMMASYNRFLTVPKLGGSPAASSGGSWGDGPYKFTASNKHGWLKLTVGQPIGAILGLFSSLPIICPNGLQALKTNPDALDTNVYGSGPYTLVSATHGAQIIYKLRKSWKWGPPGTSTKTMPGTLVYKIVDDQTTGANLLLTGGLDIADINGPDVSRLLASKSLGHVPVANWDVANLAFNMRPGRPFALGAAGNALRTAIYEAVSPTNFNKVVYDGRAHQSPTDFRENAVCFDKKTLKMAPKPSISAAKAVLTKAGYTVVNGVLSKNGTAVPKLTLVSSASTFPNGGAYIQSVLTQLGFQVQLQDLTAAYGPTIIAGDFDMAIVYANRPSPAAGTQMNSAAGIASPAGENIGATGMGDPNWNNYYTEGVSTSGPRACAAFAKLQEDNIRNHYALPLTSADYEIFYNKSIVSKLPTWAPEVFGYPWFDVAVK